MRRWRGSYGNFMGRVHRLRTPPDLKVLQILALVWHHGAVSGVLSAWVAEGEDLHGVGTGGEAMSGETTPGPWVWRWKSGELCTVGTPPYAFGKSVLFPDDNQSVIVSDADARLIAAAPDLLEAVRQAKALIVSGNWEVDSEISNLEDSLDYALAKIDQEAK